MDGWRARRARGTTAHLPSFSFFFSWQRTGLGAALFAEAEARARAHPSRTLNCKVVDVRPEMVEYYVKKGMRPTGRTWRFVSEERLKEGVVVNFVELAKVYDAPAQGEAAEGTSA